MKLLLLRANFTAQAVAFCSHTPYNTRLITEQGG
jgi:hypothetical protein